MNLPDQKTWNSQKPWNELASPSNLAMAALVGFLFVGQATDWKILSGRKSKASSSVKFAAPELSRGSELSRTGAHHSRHVRAGSLRDLTLHDSTRADPNSEVVADRGSATREAQQGSEQRD